MKIEKYKIITLNKLCKFFKIKYSFLDFLLPWKIVFDMLNGEEYISILFNNRTITINEKEIKKLLKYYKYDRITMLKYDRRGEWPVYGNSNCILFFKEAENETKRT